jgi:hypothetical protein
VDAAVGGAADTRHALRVTTAPPRAVGPSPVWGETGNCGFAAAPTRRAVGRGGESNSALGATWAGGWRATPSGDVFGASTATYSPSAFSGPWVALAPVPRLPGRGPVVDGPWATWFAQACNYSSLRPMVERGLGGTGPVVIEAHTGGAGEPRSCSPDESCLANVLAIHTSSPFTGLLPLWPVRD